MALDLQCKYYSEFASMRDTDETHIAFREWIAHVEMHFLALNITENPRKIAILLLQGGNDVAKHYARANDETFASVKTHLLSKFVAVNGKFYSRFKLAHSRQHADESIEQYVERLKRILDSCSIVDEVTVNDQILQTIATNTNSQALQKYILGTVDVTLENVMKEAKTLELVNKENKLISQTMNKFSINAVNTSQKPDVSDCRNCGRNHDFNKCPAYGKACHKCSVLNHFANKCRQTAGSRPQGSRGAFRASLNPYNHKHTSNAKPPYHQYQSRPSNQYPNQSNNRRNVNQIDYTLPYNEHNEHANLYQT